MVRKHAVDRYPESDSIYLSSYGKPAGAMTSILGVNYVKWLRASAPHPKSDLRKRRIKISDAARVIVLAVWHYPASEHFVMSGSYGRFA